jgi:arylsulfatase A-like enzyme
LYAGEVTFVDKWIGILLNRIRELGLYDNTLIMFTSDHGEPFGEHGIIRKARPSGYEELAHIPWVIHHPGGLGKGRRFPCLVQPPDMMPTILDVLGISTNLAAPYAAPKGVLLPQDIITKQREASLTGRSLLPILAEEKKSIRDFAVTAHHGRQWAIRTQEWSYFLNFDGRPPELYNRKADPAEQRNIITKNQDMADELELRLRRFADEVS